MWEIILHITTWAGAVRRRLGGEAVQLSPEQDWPGVTNTTEVAWSASIEALKHAHAELLESMSRLDDSRLKDIVPGKDYSVYLMLHGLIQHDLYHAGQIVILKKAV